MIELGEIDGGPGAPLRIQVPGTARVGESALVEVVTYGDGCVSFESTDLLLSEEGAEITPYDRRRVGGGGCPLILWEFNHDTTVAFDTPGSKLIRINGRRTGSFAGKRTDEVVQLSFSINVE